jgi:membrane dipeptidase
MRISWHDLVTDRADRAHGKTVEIVGWPTALLPAGSADYFLLTGEANCCGNCVPANPLAVVEIFAQQAIDLGQETLRLTGRLSVVRNDPVGWRYQLRAARRVGGMTRRTLLAAGSLACLPIPAAGQVPSGTIDMHSHAGNVAHVYQQNGNEPFFPLAAPMRQGGMSAICLAMIADTPTTDHAQGRSRPYRSPNPGELYKHGERAFERLHRLVQEQGLTIIRDVAGLRSATADRPSVVVSAEGGDFLEGVPDRVDEAYERWQLRHLQLTHFRPNELGDTQTEPAEHDGLTGAGAEVIRRCNKLGVIVDVAHGTFELVKKAATVTTKPLVLSHTSLTDRPLPWTRCITSEHAQAIRETGGVVGVWPNLAYFQNYEALAKGFAKMVDSVGIDHVGLGTDQLGLPGGSTMPSYAELPLLTGALLARFTVEETSKLLGGNYRRVFEATLG